MKFIYIIITLLLNYNTQFAQNQINTKWYYDLKDKSIKKKESQNKNIPVQLIETKDKDLLIASQGFFGWMLQKLDVKTGKIIWENSRNQDFPDSTKKLYIYDALTERTDSNIDIFGSRSRLNEAGLFTSLSGYPIRCTYDIKTGKEIKCYQDTINNKPNYLGFAFNNFVPKNHNYIFFSRSTYKDSSFYMGTIDSSMVIKDTLTWFTKGQDLKNPDTQIYGISPILNSGNFSYLMIYEWAGKSDTTSYRHYFLKVNHNGKVEMDKNIARDLYYYIYYTSYAMISDGFLVSGVVDTTNNNFNNQNLSTRTAIVAKIDTTGKKAWEAKLYHPDGTQLQGGATAEDVKRKGYWAFTYKLKEKRPFLYFINSKGVPIYIGQVETLKEEEAFAPNNLLTLENGDLIITFKYARCNNGKENVLPCFGVGLIEAATLDKYLVGIKENQAQFLDFQLFPNPSNDYLTLKFENEFSGKINCYNSLGQFYFTKKVTNENMLSIDTQHFPNGIYYLEVIANEMRMNRKVVIQH